MQPVQPKPPERMIPAKSTARWQHGVRTHVPSNHARSVTGPKDDRCAPWSIHWLPRRARAARNPGVATEREPSASAFRGRGTAIIRLSGERDCNNSDTERSFSSEDATK